MILETKYRLVNKLQIEEAYIQAKSYALRLEAKVIVLAAMDGLWVFASGKSSSSFLLVMETNWEDIKNPDALHRLKNLIGLNALKKIT